MGVHKKQITKMFFSFFCVLFFNSAWALGASDPYQVFNRSAYKLNDRLDKAIIKPISSIYQHVVPKPINIAIRNFLGNLNNLPIFANDLLQLNGRAAIKTATRFTVNSTLGFFGCVDVAQGMHVRGHQNDFGLTLAKWGYQQSNYLVLPFLGLGSVRDFLGKPVDYYGFSVYPRIESDDLRYGLYGMSIISKREQLLNLQNVMSEVAVDEYSFAKDAYFQKRAQQIEDSKQGFLD